jgi:potassium efflux system protein
MSRLEARHARKEEGEISDAVSAVAAKPEVGLAQMRKQSRRLLQWAMAALFVGGLWLIWSGVVPALGGVLNEPLWTYTADNNPLKILQVTYQDLMAAAVVLLLTLAASKNIPGLMQIVLLKRLEMASSGVYVVTALTRYVVLIVGFVVAFGLLGISWGKIQVLVAAVTLGLSFGLQEIFANFISGLILLLERPIRIGDVVTVGDVTGVVSRIRTRATTITDFNHKELIVPNKAFITGQLVNWTLSDTILRLAIPVSILHGSDVDLAQRLLMEAANKSSLVLKEPPPIVRLLTLETKVTLELKVCVSNMDNYRKAGHELLVAIERSFRENRIPLM